MMEVSARQAAKFIGLGLSSFQINNQRLFFDLVNELNDDRSLFSNMSSLMNLVGWQRFPRGACAWCLSTVLLVSSSDIFIALYWIA